jgi:hypothetical protein
MLRAATGVHADASSLDNRGMLLMLLLRTHLGVQKVVAYFSKQTTVVPAVVPFI